MNILFVGDIVGKPGKFATHTLLPKLKKEYQIDLCIANGENVSGGKGISERSLKKLFHYGIDVVTSGNHIWHHRDYQKYLNSEAKILRPLNYPPQVPGRGILTVKTANGVPVTVMNFQGRTYLFDIDCPFQTFLREMEKRDPSVKVIIIDFHAEATSEKLAFGYFADGKVSAVIGTHTHVQTADARIFPQGTGYITDVGMTGSFDSVIGVVKEKAIQKFLYNMPVPFELAKENPCLQGLFLTIDESSGKTTALERIFRPVGITEGFDESDPD